MRQRRPNSQGGGSNNNYNKHRHQRPGGGGHNNNRPRKNYAALREKYTNQARDALAAGDRVMAEYFYQHADHCYRMMMEEGYRPYNQQQQQPQQVAGEEAANTAPVMEEEMEPANTNALPAFITAAYQQPAQQQPVDPATIQNWEERDAG